MKYRAEIEATERARNLWGKAAILSAAVLCALLLGYAVHGQIDALVDRQLEALK